VHQLFRRHFLGRHGCPIVAHLLELPARFLQRLGEHGVFELRVRLLQCGAGVVVVHELPRGPVRRRHGGGGLLELPCRRLLGHGRFRLHAVPDGPVSGSQRVGDDDVVLDLRGGSVLARGRRLMHELLLGSVPTRNGVGVVPRLPRGCGVGRHGRRRRGHLRSLPYRPLLVVRGGSVHGLRRWDVPAFHGLDQLREL
jgi:hypothetical protein